MLERDHTPEEHSPDRGPSNDATVAPIGDRHQRLWEAASHGCCAEGDLLALMPSVEGRDLPWIDGRAWITRILGF